MVNRQNNSHGSEELIQRIRQHLQQLDVQKRIQESIRTVRANATVTTSGASRLLELGEQQLRDWEKRGLISTERSSTEGKQTLGHRQFALAELEKLAVMKELIKEGHFAPGDFENISTSIEGIWREVAATEQSAHHPTPGERQEETEPGAQLAIDARIKEMRA